MDYSPPGSSVYGILQAREGKLPFPSPGDLPNPGMEPRCPTLQANSLPSEPPGNPRLGIKPIHVSCIGQWVLTTEPPEKPYLILKLHLK